MTEGTPVAEEVGGAWGGSAVANRGSGREDHDDLCAADLCYQCRFAGKIICLALERRSPLTANLDPRNSVCSWAIGKAGTRQIRSTGHLSHFSGTTTDTSHIRH